jgi:predicted lipoprotein with Yx(FWY)xxD motif
LNPRSSPERGGGARRAAPIALLIAGALGLGGCGSSGSGASTASASQAPPPTEVATAAARNPKLHGATILVDAKGFALYAFSKDPPNTFHSRCAGACEAKWPPLILSGAAPVAGGEALASQLGAIKRPSGSLQVAYAGHPLYTYARERKPGTALGNGLSAFGGTWHALTPQGTPVSR